MPGETSRFPGGNNLPALPESFMEFCDYTGLSEYFVNNFMKQPDKKRRQSEPKESGGVPSAGFFCMRNSRFTQLPQDAMDAASGWGI